MSLSAFIPRTAFPLSSLPRSYFLGHHKAGLEKMKQTLGSIDLVLECRDYRVPLTSRNPLFEGALEGKERAVIYTHRDLGSGAGNREGDKQEHIIRKWHDPIQVLFTRSISSDSSSSARTSSANKGKDKGKKSVDRVLDFLREHARQRWKLVGHRVMIVGMPNVGKSTLINALRAQGLGKGKVAVTGAQPGVTRKVSTGIKIIPSEDDIEAAAGSEAEKSRHKGVGGGVYLLDTPGVFIPYVPDGEAMMKLALCGSVKDSIVSPVMLADYLLYHINRIDPTLYSEYCGPTNEIVELLEGIAKKTGRLVQGGRADTEATALWMIQRWRMGHLGRFLLDDIEEGGLESAKRQEEDVVPSISQARRAERERRRERGRMRAGKPG